MSSDIIPHSVKANMKFIAKNIVKISLIDFSFSL